MMRDRYDKHDLTLPALEDDWEVTTCSNLTLTVSRGQSIGLITQTEVASAVAAIKIHPRYFFITPCNSRRDKSVVLLHRKMKRNVALLLRNK